MHLLKNLGIYYALIFVPLFLVIGASKNALISSGWFVFLFFVYAFIYRPVIDFYRLKSKGVVKHEFKYFQTFGYAFEYFKDLYWI